MENFHYTTERLQLPSSASLADIEAAGTAFCRKPWAQLEEELVQGRGVPEKYVANTCFGSAYIFTLLHDGFHIGRDEKRLVFSNTAKGPAGD